MSSVHPSAVIEDGARVGEGCSIGPFCVVGARVSLAPGVVLKSHVVVTGRTEIGAGTVVYPFAVLGEIPQDLKYDGEETRLVIGRNNVIREHCAIHVGTALGGGITEIGDGGLYMSGVHIAHDVRIGDRVIVASNTAVAGHCQIADDVIVGGVSGIHQWVRIGRGAIIGAHSMVAQDVLPHGLVQGPRAILDGLNLVGLKRKGVSRADITALRAAFQMLKDGEGTFAERAERLRDESTSEYVQQMVEFILGESHRSFLVPGG